MKSIISFVLSMLALWIPCANNAFAAVILSETAAGYQAVAGTDNGDGCVQTQSSLLLDDRITTTKSDDGSVFESHTRFLTISLFQADFCNNKVIMFGQGFIPFVPDEVAPVFDKKLNSVRIALTVPVFNQIDGTISNTAIDVTLTAIEAATTDDRRDVVIMPDQREKQRMQDTFRLASLTGSIFDGTREYMLGGTQAGGISAFSDNYRIKF
jgi:hypothetical protein